MKDSKWLVIIGKWYSDGYPYAVFDKRKDAEKGLRDENFRWNKAQQLFIDSKNERWASVEAIDYNKLD